MTGRRIDRLITMKEAAGILGVSESTVRRMIQDGRLTRYRKINRIRLSENEVVIARIRRYKREQSRYQRRDK